MKHRSFIEVLPSNNGGWFYHEKSTNGKIKNASQVYTRKSSAKRAGMREAWEQSGQCKVYDKDGHIQQIFYYNDLDV